MSDKETRRAYRMDPDFRRAAPESGAYCVCCQRAIHDPEKAVRVTVDWDTHLVTEGGEELMGMDCWNRTSKLEINRER